MTAQDLQILKLSIENEELKKAVALLKAPLSSQLNKTKPNTSRGSALLWMITRGLQTVSLFPAKLANI
ncbi:hypothetical protein PGB90_006902 [Kerria lacca]